MKLFAFAITLAIGVVALLAWADDVEANHLRGGTLEWTATEVPNQIELTGRLFGKVQWSGSGPNYGWDEPPDKVGSAVETHGIEGSPTGGQAVWVVDYVSDAGTPNKNDDWFSASMEPVTIQFSTPRDSTGPWRLAIQTSARITAGDGHMNNAAGQFRLETDVDLTPTLSGASPRVLFPPIVPCERGEVCSFMIPSTGDSDRAFRLSTGREATGTADTSESGLLPGSSGSKSFYQPGEDDAFVSDAEIDESTGRYTWDTTGADDASGPHTLYSTQVMVVDGNGKVPMDFFIELVDELPDKPEWIVPPSPCDQTIRFIPGQEILIEALAEIPGGGQVTVDLLGGPPDGEVELSPGSPGQAIFRWTPADDATDDEILVFLAYAGSGAQSDSCPVTLELEPNELPIADFSFTDLGYTTGQTVDFADLSYDTDGNIVERRMVMGDGRVLTEFPKDFSYSAIGDMEVTLTVKDNRGDSVTSATKIVKVVNRPPVAKYSGPNSLSAGEVGVWSDASTDLDGNIKSRTWDLGDGTIVTGDQVNHAFAGRGEYYVCLEVVDEYNFKDQACRSVFVENNPPTVKIEHKPGLPAGSTAAVHEFYCIAADSDGTVESCIWQFGDGARSEGHVVSHKFAVKKSTNYEVTVTVTDDYGDTATDTALVHVYDQAPVSVFSFYREPGDPIEMLRFSSDSRDQEGPLVYEAWSFGDGHEETGRTVVHSFADPSAIYEIKLKVQDNIGANATSIVHVRPSEVKVIYDADGDGVEDGLDNCPASRNPRQSDMDGDGLGDLCDDDRDGDGVENTADDFPDDPRVSKFYSKTNQTSGDHDTDGDGISDSDEAQLGTNPYDQDSDGDGLSDLYEILSNTDPMNSTSPGPGQPIIIMPTTDGERLSWSVPNSSQIGSFEVLVDGVVVDEIFYTGPGNYSSDIQNYTGVFSVRAKLQNGEVLALTVGNDAQAEFLAPASKSLPVWPFVAGGGASIAGIGGAGIYWWRRKLLAPL